ncbi:MAG: glycosyltransferase [Acidobacteria bacterium]|nr:glycosyltransferase [Acidobacteriota bacterium]
MTSRPLLSLAIPVYNEEEVLPLLLAQLRELLDRPSFPSTEIVLVNDGSRDATPRLLDEAAARDPRLTVVHLSRNFGHQAALTAALDHVHADVAVVMDADLQDSPSIIPRFLEKHAEGYDVVYAIRASRQEGPLLRFCYRAYYRLLNMVSESRAPLDAGDFALLSRPVLDQLRGMREHNRYLRGLRHWAGFRQIGIEVDRDARAGGRSNYSALRLFKLAIDGIFSFSVVPLRAMAAFGAATVSAAVAYAGYTIYSKLVWGDPPQGFAALISAIVFLAGVQMLFLGVIGEYVGRIYEEVKGRPIYIADRVVRGDRWTESTFRSTASYTTVTGGGEPVRSGSST